MIDELDDLAVKARLVEDWMDGGCSSWGVPTGAIRSLAKSASLLLAMKEALVEAREYVSYHTRPAPQYVKPLLAKIDATLNQGGGSDK